MCDPYTVHSVFPSHVAFFQRIQLLALCQTSQLTFFSFFDIVSILSIYDLYDVEIARTSGLHYNHYVSPSVGGQLVKILITLEIRGLF